MNSRNHKNLIFFGELPPTSKNGISHNNLRFLKKIKIHFNKIIFIKDLPHKSFISYFKISIKLLFFFYKNIINNDSINYFTLSQGNVGIIKSLFLSTICIFSNNKYIVHLHRGDLIYNCKKSYLKLLISRYILSNCFLILFISKIQRIETLDFFKINENKAIFIPNFLHNLSLIEAFDNKKKEDLKKFPKLIKIIYVGPLVKSKGIDKLIELLFKNKKSNEIIFNYNLSIFGKNVDKDILLRYKKEISKSEIKYYGEVTHKKVLENIEKSDLLILPSLSEGMPYVVLESILLNTPVICTNVGYIKEILGWNYPLFFDIHSKSSLIKKMNYFYQNRIEIFNTNYKIRKNISKYYSKNNFKKFLDIIKI